MPGKGDLWNIAATKDNDRGMGNRTTIGKRNTTQIVHYMYIHLHLFFRFRLENNESFFNAVIERDR